MKTLIFGIALLAAGLAYADTEHNIKVNRIEMTEAATDEGDDQKDSIGATRATDYNSSRSNRGDAVRLDDDVDAGDASDGTRATDYNSSRSNKADSAKASDADETGDEAVEARATDYNSSRSNKSFAAAIVDDCDASDNENSECTKQ